VFPADFAYVRAESLEDALTLLAAGGADGEGETPADIKILAGGQSLLPMMKLRLAVPDLLVDIGGLAELAYAAADGALTRIGALTTYRQLQRDPLIARRFPAFGDALAVLADPQVRARGTIGGSVAHGDPAADMLAVLLAVDAQVTVAGRGGLRAVPLDDFLLGVFTTQLGADEIVTEIVIPHAAAIQAYEKFEQPASHLPLAGVCVAADVVGGVINEPRIAVTGVAGRAFRARAAEEILRGTVLRGTVLRGGAAGPAAADVVRAAAARVADGVEPLADQHASGPFRLHLAEVLTRRALARALTRAGTPQFP